MKDKISLLSEDERPELISRSEVEAKGHISRLTELEEGFNSIALQNLDGTNSMYIFSEPVKYIDEAGIIRDKKAELTQCNDVAYKNEYSYSNANNDVRVFFPKTLDSDTGVILGKNDINIELTPVSSKKLETSRPENAIQSLESGVRLKNITAQAAVSVKRDIEKSGINDTDIKAVVDYNAVFGSKTTLSYTPTLNGFKEDIVLASYDGTNEFVFRLKTNGLRLINKDGIYYLIEPDTSKKIVTMGELVVYGNGGTEISSGYEHKYYVETVTQDDEYLLTVIVDKNYLINENTKYPVIVDPSFEVLSEDNDIMDISVRAIGSVISRSQNDAVGNHYTEKKDMRTFIKFPGLLNNHIFQDMAPYGLGGGDFPEVQSIKLMMYSRGTSQVTGQVKVYPYNASAALDWTYNTTNFTTTQYNAVGNQWSSTAVPSLSEQWVEFNITSAVSVPCDKGIVLINEYEGEGNYPAYQSFASTKDSTNKPRIVVNWISADNDSFDNATNMTLNKYYAVDISATSSKRYYMFTPSSTGFYTFQSTDNDSYDTIGKLYNSAQVCLAQDDDSGSYYNFKMTYHLQANQKYYLEAGCYAGETGTYTVNVSNSTGLTGLSSSAISLSTSGTAKITEQFQRKYFTLTPVPSGSYTIESSATSGDPYGWLYNSSGTIISSNDDGAGNKNFRMNYKLTAGQKYYIVAGCFSTGVGNYSINVSVDVPEPPTNLAVSNITGNSVYLTWETASPHRADRWLIQYRTSGGSWTDAKTSTSKNCTVSGLDASKTYDFRVYSEAGSPAWSGTWSSASNIVSAKTLPAQPTEVAVSSYTDCRVNLVWNTASPHGADRWVIQCSKNGGSWVDRSTTTYKGYSASSLDASATYSFRVYGERDNSDGSKTRSLVSNTVSVQTLPAQPTDVTVNSYTESTVHITWNTASPHGADRWLIQCRKNGGSWTNRNTSTYKGYVASELEPGATYEFRVYGERGSTAWEGVRSPVSNTVSVTTLSSPSTVLTAEALQTAFYNSPRGGDWDNSYGLQCVDLFKWFIDNYTTLTNVSGNGKDCAPNLAATNNLPTSSTPTPFSVFSVDSYVIGMGGTGVYEGHTGVVLSVNTSNKTCVVFHTGNSLEGKNPNSWISTCSYDIDGLTFVDVRNFLK